MSSNENADKLHKILFDTNNKQDEMEIFISTHTREERLNARKEYEQVYSKDNKGLIDDLRDVFSGDFRDLMVKIFSSRAELDADQYIRAFNLFTSNDSTVYELLLSRPQWLKDEASKAYEEKTNVKLEDDLGKMNKDVREILPMFLKTERRQNKEPDHEKCQSEAEKLIKTPIEDWTKTEEIIKGIFAEASPEELTLICRYYLRRTGTTVLEAAQKLPKNQRIFFTDLLFNVISPAELFAVKLHDSIKGLGTDTNLLERMVVTRYDVDMFIMKKYYFQFYKTSIKEDIAGDVKGPYLKVLSDLLDYQTKEDI